MLSCLHSRAYSFEDPLRYDFLLGAHSNKQVNDFTVHARQKDFDTLPAQFLIDLGIIDETTKIMQNADYFRPIFIMTGIWKEAGYSSIVYFAAIMGISPVLYEALKVDGGNKLQEIRYVTFPSIAPTLINVCPFFWFLLHLESS